MKKKIPYKIILFITLIAGLFVLFLIPPVRSRLLDLINTALEFVEDSGFWGYLIFAGLYIVATVLMIPGSVLTLAAGFLFGVVKGTAVVSVSSTLGATAAFLVGRTFARDWIRTKMENSKKFSAIDRAVSERGMRIILLLRLSPVIPFNLSNYAYSLTGISLGQYFFGSWIGMLPGTLMYVYFGSLAGSLSTLGTPEAKPPIWWILFGGGLLATIAVSVWISRLAQKAVESVINPSSSNA